MLRFAALLLVLIAFGPPAAAATEALDRPALWNLVREARFEALEAHLTARQRDYEADWRTERMLSRDFVSVSRPDRRVTESLRRWAEARPESYVAQVVYGLHLAKRGWAERGTK